MDANSTSASPSWERPASSTASTANRTTKTRAGLAGSGHRALTRTPAPVGGASAHRHRGDHVDRGLRPARQAGPWNGDVHQEASADHRHRPQHHAQPAEVRKGRAAVGVRVCPKRRVSYEAGDALGVWPRNSDRLVDEWLSVTGLDAQTPVEVGEHGLMSLRSALTERFEIAHISPDLLRFVQQRTGDTELAELMKPENKRPLCDWAWGRQSGDLLAQLPVTASVDEWLSLLKPLQPRLYSISSSPKENPREVHLTVSPVRYNFQGVAAPRGVLDVPRRPLPRRSDRRLCAAVEQFPASQRSAHADDHDRSGHRDRALPRFPAGTSRARPHRPQLAVLRRTARRHRLLLPRRDRADARRRVPHRTRPGVLRATSATRSTCST